MTLLVVDCVTKSFGGRRVLSAGSLRAVPGQIRVVFGRNGCGKSTLMRIAVGWIAADSGIVRFRDRVYTRPRLASLAQLGLFYLPDHDVLSESYALGDQLRFYQERFRACSVNEAADLAQVTHLLDRRPHQLSGGELRRAELALVLVRRPACLLADEPFRGIAPVEHDLLTGLFRRLADDGCAVVVTGHEVPSLLDAAHHVTWCTSGTTYELGPPSAARAHEQFRRDYLGPSAR